MSGAVESAWQRLMRTGEGVGREELEKALIEEDPRWERWLQGEFTEEEWALLEKGQRPPFDEPTG